MLDSAEPALVNAVPEIEQMEKNKYSQASV